MNSNAKVLFLKNVNGILYRTEEDTQDKSNKYIDTDEQTKELLGVKALNVLKELEEIWELDHNNVELRDKFHLLRYYLESYLGKKY
ncbi:MAG TPA: hypothetical protein PLM71_08865 [Syntrophorhabdaceae bacterium]|nr:hypothetical protein [Syntrophorhabdaceae bacterium]HPU30418.1 hypothetical protein [Syntrophorhabdaceae bacterium]